MLRRDFMLIGAAFLGLTKDKSFTFRIKTKSGTTVSGISITAHDVEQAKTKLYKRYPNCTILEVK